MPVTFRKTIQLLIVTMTCSLLLCACTTPPPAAVDADPNILRVGVSPDAPPLVYKQDQEITGLEPEMALALAEYLEKDGRFGRTPMGGSDSGPFGQPH